MVRGSIKVTIYCHIEKNKEKSKDVIFEHMFQWNGESIQEK